jgi:kynureninase
MTATATDRGMAIARERDASDALAPFRDQFHQPAARAGETVHYLCGHSLGLMPRRARELVERELERWSALGVEGHFDSDDGWFAYHERFAAPLAVLLGAEPREVVAMNSLTVNLHLMLASFFQPEGARCRILIERDAFPSDRYAVQSQLAFHGLDPGADLVELDATSGRLAAEALDAALAAADDRVALVLLPGVQYLTGEAVDLAACTAVAHRHGCRIGFDLAHAIGNLALDLRTADPDFAVWCSYKYLNAGPGAIGGCFVNRRHIGDPSLPRFEGWWGHDKARRFEPQTRFAAIDSAEAWQLSNPPILAMAPLAASLELFDEAGIQRLREKSVDLTAFLEDMVLGLCGDRIELLSPRDHSARGAQLSFRLSVEAERVAGVAAALRAAGIIGDWRDPDVLRLAPVPLYNSYQDALAAAQALADALGA